MKNAPQEERQDVVANRAIQEEDDTEEIGRAVPGSQSNICWGCNGYGGRYGTCVHCKGTGLLPIPDPSTPAPTAQEERQDELKPFQRPLEKGWLANVLKSVRKEADSWQKPSTPVPEQGIPKRPNKYFDDRAGVFRYEGDFVVDQDAYMDALESRDVERVKRIAELEGQLEGKWISVQERLPEDDERVLAFNSKASSKYGPEYWLQRCHLYDSFPLGSLVTHWQPLPAPPSEIAKEEER